MTTNGATPEPPKRPWLAAAIGAGLLAVALIVFALCNSPREQMSADLETLPTPIPTTVGGGV